MTRKITNADEIRATLDLYMKAPPHELIVEIFSCEHRPGGIIYEGHRPIAAAEFEGVRSYTLATSDTRYQQGCAVLRLQHIEWLSVLT